MTLKEIEYLLATARCASISEAAKQLYVAQPSLTHAIQSVEREVGFRIFERGRSGISVTEQGEEFLADIRKVHEQMAAVQDKYCVDKRPIRRVFSVSAQYFSSAALAFVRFLRELEESSYSVKLLEGRIGDVVADVASERSEIGFLHFPADKEAAVLKELRSEKLEFYGIVQTESCLLMRKGHPLTSCGAVTRQDLSRYPAVFYDYRTDIPVSLPEEDAPLLQMARRIVVSNGINLVRILRETDAYAVGLCCRETDVDTFGLTSRAFDGGQALKTGWIKKTDALLRPLVKEYLRTLNSV